MIPEKIGRYQVKHEVGRGGMASVFLAHDPRFGRDVAIKILPEQFLHDPTFRGRFEREARTIAQLEHPAIVPVYDFGEQEGQPYLIMRYMSGGTLLKRMSQGALPLDEIVEILRRIGSALDYAHSKGIVHRDLKPANILFDNHGNAFLTDFGIVRLAESTATYTGSAIVGTPAYMSPEQIHGDKSIDGRSDIYSLGVITFEMLTGQVPYQANTPAKLMMAHVLDPIPRVNQFKQNVPADCQMVVDRAMAKDRDKRFSTASEMAVTLSGLNSHQATPTAAPTPALEQTLLEPFPAYPEPAPAPTDYPRSTQPAPSAVPQSASAGRRFPLWVPVVGCLFLLGMVVVLGGGAWMFSLIQDGQFGSLFGTATPDLAATTTVEFTTNEAVTAEAQAAQTVEAQNEATAEVVAALTGEAVETAGAATQEAVETIYAAQTAAIEAIQATSEVATKEAADPHEILLETGESWPLFLSDTFDEDVNGWCIGDSSSEFADGNRDISGGKYVWETTGLQDFFRYCGNTNFTNATNFYESADFQMVSGPEDGQYGLLIRRQDADNHILFEIEDDGYFKVEIQLAGEWETLIDWTESDLIRSGQINNLAVVTENTHFTLYINNSYVGEFDEDRLTGGYGGLFISLDGGQSSTMEFDNFIVRSP
ncbi:MAG: protein kinase [Candidatus Promineifilaceae bacterium]